MSDYKHEKREDRIKLTENKKISFIITYLCEQWRKVRSKLNSHKQL